MTDAEEAAETLFARARALHASGDVAGGIALAREALAHHPAHTGALEHLSTVLITRSRRYSEGLELIERAVAARPEDAGLWYSAGWCYEFVAHEIARRGGAALDPRALYERAAEAFRRCLALGPEGKLAGDAADLLDHVENELANL